MAFDPNDPDTKKALDDAVAAATAEANKAATAEKAAAAKELEEVKNQLNQFAGLDADKLRKMIESQQADADKALLREGKVDELVQQRVDRLKVGFEQQITQLNAQAESTQGEITRLRGRALEAEVQAAAADMGFHPSAVSDAVARAQGVFAVDKEGKVVAQDGNVDAKGLPQSLKGWLEGCRTTAPHWFKQAGGTGAAGNTGTTPAQKKPEEMSEQERADLFRSDPASFNRLFTGA